MMLGRRRYGCRSGLAPSRAVAPGGGGTGAGHAQTLRAPPTTAHAMRIAGCVAPRTVRAELAPEMHCLEAEPNPMRTMSRLAIAFLFLAACKPTAAPPAPSGPVGHMEHGMGNCPSAVTGSVTSMKVIAGGVELDITADDLDAAREIVDRANRHSAAGGPADGAAMHSGGHGGPGDIGHCPVVHKDTTVTVTEIGGGVRITVLAVDPAQAPALERETRERINWLDPANRSR